MTHNWKICWDITLMFKSIFDYTFNMKQKIHPIHRKWMAVEWPCKKLISSLERFHYHHLYQNAPASVLAAKCLAIVMFLEKIGEYPTWVLATMKMVAWHFALMSTAVRCSKNFYFTNILFTNTNMTKATSSKKGKTPNKYIWQSEDVGEKKIQKNL